MAIRRKRRYGGLTRGLDLLGRDDTIGQVEWDNASDVRRGGLAADRYRRALRGEAPQEDNAAFKQYRQIANDAANREKDFVHKWTELFFKARESGDAALQKHMLSSGREYVAMLSPQSRALLEPILRQGPFSPMQAKMEQFDKHNPAPSFGKSEYVIETRDGVMEGYEKQSGPTKDTHPLAYANHLFQVEDHKADRETFATGKTPSKRNLISYDAEKGLYAMRDKDGHVSIVNEEMLGLQDFAKRMDTTVGAVIQNGGAYGKPVKSYANGMAIEYRPFTTLDGKTNMERMSGRTAEQLHDQDDKMMRLLATLTTDNDKLLEKDPIAQRIISLDKGEDGFDKSVAPYLEQLYPGRVFIKPKQEASWWDHAVDLFKSGDYVKNGGFVEGDNSTIMWRPGVRTPIKLSNGKIVDAIHDQENDMIYEATNGALIGKTEDAIKKLEDRFALNEQRRRMLKDEEDEQKQRVLDSDIYSSGSY